MTEQHRVDQLRLRDLFLAEFIGLWVLLDSARLDETGAGWGQAVMRAVRSWRQRSAVVATDYYLRFDAVESPEPIPTPRIPWDDVPDGDDDDDEEPASEVRPSRVRFDVDESAFERPSDDRRVRVDLPEIDWAPHDRATEVSLIVTGPVGQKAKRARGKTEEQARDDSFVEASGAASRQVLTGGRQSLLRLAEDNMRVKGYTRVTDGDPCSWCAMLAARGPVYKSEASAGRRSNASAGQHRKRDKRQFLGSGNAKVHDGCGCTIEPVYTSDTMLPGRGREWQQLWNDHIRGRYTGPDAVRAWRRLYEQQQREQRRAA